MIDRCDATARQPEAAAITWLDRADRELRLCQHHSERHAAGLMVSGWFPIPDRVTPGVPAVQGGSR